MYSLNQDRSVLAILERLGMLDISTPVRALPFRPSSRIESEAVRPVHWQLRPKSYVQRTFAWSALPAASWAEAQCVACTPYQCSATPAGLCYLTSEKSSQHLQPRAPSCTTLLHTFCGSLAILQR